MHDYATHAHMTTAVTGAIVMSHADCSCGWRGARHLTTELGSVLSAWEAAVADRNVHKLTHQEVTP